MRRTRPPQPSDAPENISRRRFVGAAAAALATAATAATAAAGHAAARRQQPAAAPPNFVVIVNDQERFEQHWPAGWSDANLPVRKSLKDRGLSFTRAYINASMCSPSRATLYTGLYPTQHGLTRTLTYGGAQSHLETPLPSSVQTIAKLLKTVGYRVVLKGKWHVSKHADGSSPTAADVAAFGFDEWEPTTAGEAQHVDGFGGGCADWDAKIAGQAADWLAAQSPASGPFCLVVCLVNPHDVIAYPSTWDSSDGGCTAVHNYENIDLNQGITLPPTNSNDPADGDIDAVPSCHQGARDLFAFGLGTLLTQQQRLDYVNFYAALHKLSDAHMGTVLDAIPASLRADTIVVHTADHGEMGLSHDGMRQKMFCTYEEALHIPLVIADPRRPSSHGKTTDALASLVDITPTLAELAGIQSAPLFHFAGRSLAPLLDAPNAEPQSELYFEFHDEAAGNADGMPNNPLTGQPFVAQPCHISAMVRKDADGVWKFARYYDPSNAQPPEYEMYHLLDGAGAPIDPHETYNYGYSGHALDDFYAEKLTFLQARLLELERERLDGYSPPRRTHLPLTTRK